MQTKFVAICGTNKLPEPSGLATLHTMLDAQESLEDQTRQPAQVNLVELFSANSLKDTFCALAGLLEQYEISRFSVYVMSEGEARLEFSRGLSAALQTSAEHKIKLSEYPPLSRFEESTDLYWHPETLLPEDPERSMDNNAADKNLLNEATVVFKLQHNFKTLGFLVAYGMLPDSLFESPRAQNFANMLHIFSAVLQRLRGVELLQRNQVRLASRLNTLEEGRDILLLTDLQEILMEVLRRSLQTVGSQSGSIWLWNDSRWDMGYLMGNPSTEGMAEVDRLLETCGEKGIPVAVSSLSGEDIMSFDVDTIHMASAAGFPISARGERIGCIVAFDAMVSQESVDIIGGTVILAGIAIENARRRDRILDQQRMQEQLAVAAKVQQRLLPTEKAKHRDLSVAFYSRYCDETGGDYVDHVPLSDPKMIAFSVGDVSGHGVGAALLMVDVRAQIRTLLRIKDALRPDNILGEVNPVLCKESGDEEFATLVLGTLDTRSGAFIYASAGHEPALIYRQDTGLWDELPSTGLPLGMLESASYDMARVFLRPGDVLLFLTDGVTEAIDRTGKPFGQATVKNAVKETASQGGQSILDALVQQTFNQCDPAKLNDDVTYLLVKVERITLQQMEKLPEPKGTCLYASEYASSRSAKDEQLEKVIELLCNAYPEEDLSGLFMSAEEALTNAVLHGNKESDDLKAELQIWETPTGPTLLIRDQGVGFDPFSILPERFDDDVLSKESGRGILMMISMMDEVIYADEGRAVWMHKDCSTNKQESDT